MVCNAADRVMLGSSECQETPAPRAWMQKQDRTDLGLGVTCSMLPGKGWELCNLWFMYATYKLLFFFCNIA